MLNGIYYDLSSGKLTVCELENHQSTINGGNLWKLSMIYPLVNYQLDPENNYK